MTAGHPPTRNSRAALVALFFGLVTLAGCARNPIVGSVSVPPIPEREARLWFYRLYDPSETLNMTEISMNGAYAGYAQLGGAFYRNVPPGCITLKSRVTAGMSINRPTWPWRRGRRRT